MPCPLMAFSSSYPLLNVSQLVHGHQNVCQRWHEVRGSTTCRAASLENPNMVSVQVTNDEGKSPSHVKKSKNGREESAGNVLVDQLSRYQRGSLKMKCLKIQEPREVINALALQRYMLDLLECFLVYVDCRSLALVLVNAGLPPAISKFGRCC